jgi:hypothetical protein
LFLLAGSNHGRWIAQLLKDRAELYVLRDDAERLDWLEQKNWDADELWELVNNWTTQDGKRHGAGLRSAIDAARKGGR